MRQFSTKRRKNDRQFLWEYMRRNRICKVEDMLPLVDEMSLDGMKVYFRQLENAGYVKVRVQVGHKRAGRFIDRTYVLVKNTGVLSPVWVKKQNRLYDRNTQQLHVRELSHPAIEISKNIAEVRPVDPEAYDKGRVLTILREEAEPVEVNELMLRCGLTKKRFQYTVEELYKERQIVSYMRNSTYYGLAKEMND